MGGILRPHAVRLASIDVGTNTALLCVADVSSEGLKVVEDREVFVRLGEAVDASGMISREAAARLLKTMSAYREAATSLGAVTIVGVATSASRDARNALEVLDAVERATGIRLRVITGDDEARLTFLGGVSELGETVDDVCSLDIGGGSTEITCGGRGDSGWVISRHKSTPAGAIRVRDRFFSSIPPESEEVDRASAAIDAWLEHLVLPPGVLLLGTSGTTVALAQLLRRHDEPIVPTHPSGLPAIPRETVDRWCRRLLAMGEAEVLRLDPAVMTGRADVFPAGVLVLARVMRQFDIPQLIVSSRGLRHGVLLDWLRRA